jgi:hypothetical protein
MARTSGINRRQKVAIERERKDQILIDQAVKRGRLPDYSEPARRLAVCYHEASHAVVWILGGYKIDCVNIKQSVMRDENGRPIGVANGGAEMTLLLKEISREDAESYMAGSFGAVEGEMKFNGGNTGGEASDVRKREVICSHLEFSSAERTELLERGLHSAKSMLEVSANWAAIVELAELVNKQTYVDGPLVHDIVSKHCGETKLRDIANSVVVRFEV